MADEESNGLKPKNLTTLDLGTIDPRAKSFKCPCCGVKLQFKLSVNVFGVYELLEDEDGVEHPVTARRVDRFTSEERELIETLRSNGVLEAFAVAASAATSSKVFDIESHLLKFLRTAIPVNTPQFAIRLCLPEDERAGDLSLWQLNTVAAVIADGEMRCFLPTDLIKGRTLSKLQSVNGTIKPTDSVDLDTWIKTKFGYVSGRGAMFQELRKRAAGSFDNVSG